MMKRSSVLALAAALAGMPALASAACVGTADMHALEAAALQQKLMVAALTCHDVKAYNGFVLGHRAELQKSDATLLAFFKKTGKGSAGYHTYKTHLANAASLRSTRDGGFCGEAHMWFAKARGPLIPALDEMGPRPTGFAACHAPGVHTASLDTRVGRAAPTDEDRDAVRDPRDDDADDARAPADEGRPVIRLRFGPRGARLGFVPPPPPPPGYAPPPRYEGPARGYDGPPPDYEEDEDEDGPDR